jgi:hypothetical protein
LLALGVCLRFDVVRALPVEALGIPTRHPTEVLDYFDQLPPGDRAPFIKAFAAYEDRGRGAGSTTLLHEMLASADYALIDWVLRNTGSYWYYAHGAQSYAEYEAIAHARAEVTAGNVKRDAERQTSDQRRIAAAATAKLPNAIRRGDALAIRALLAKGAQEFRSGGTETTQMGYVNRNGQRCDGHRGTQGTDHLQHAYRITCTAEGCGAVYGANGSDVFQRRCPRHQGGAPGIEF